MTLAIKGNATRGKEVIEILEMLGGQNYSHHFLGKTEYNYYYIGNYSTISCIPKEKLNESFITYTLEQFIEKFPYKVGDNVMTDDGDKADIVGMVWDNDINDVFYKIQICNEVFKYPKELLQPYKEETMEDYLVTEDDYVKAPEVEQEYMNAAEMLMNQLADGTRWKCGNFDAQKMIAMFLKKNKSMFTEKEDSIIVDIPKGYEFAEVDNDKQQVVFTKIQPQYPKTYEECCEILSIDTFYKLRYYTYEHGYNEYTTSNKLCSLQDKLNILGKLLICLYAYWEIAGEQMGLGKPWEPDWDDGNEFKYGLYHLRNGIMRDGSCINPTLLAFPTEEMRDAFFENFKNLIEQCKELL